jgi:thiopeptide-type bacteriocin biosynthesis protein
VPDRLQNQVLRQLPSADDGVLGRADRWFFIRYYRDGLVSRPHLRLRVFGQADYLTGTVFPWLHTWACQLRSDGLAGDLRLVPFDAEVERYGGPQMYPAVEKLAHADSLAVVETLRADRYGLSDLPVLALSCLDLLRAVDPAAAHRQWLQRFHGHPDPRWRADVRAHAASGWLPAAIGPAADDAWAARRAAAAEVAAAIAAQEATAERCWSPPGRIVESIVHLHCNRMVGRHAALERDALRLVLDAAATLAATGAGTNA